MGQWCWHRCYPIRLRHTICEHGDVLARVVTSWQADKKVKEAFKNGADSKVSAYITKALNHFINSDHRSYEAEVRCSQRSSPTL